MVATNFFIPIIVEILNLRHEIRTEKWVKYTTNFLAFFTILAFSLLCITSHFNFKVFISTSIVFLILGFYIPYFKKSNIQAIKIPLSYKQEQALDFVCNALKMVSFL